MAVITVSRGMGAGGEEIAFAVASKLGWPYLDREIIQGVASEAGVSEESLSEVERGPSMLDRMLDFLARYPAEDTFHWPYEPGIRAVDSTERYRKLIASFIRTIASRGPAVIVGHGATAVLAGHPRVLRVMFVASNPVRIQRVMEREGLDAKQAETRIRDTDKAWRQYLKTSFDIDWMHPHHYDLVIHTDRLPFETIIDIVAMAALAIDSQSPAATA